ncbi:helix-turn-helix transcriptional regulator [Streptomyces albicerus]|uniref:helix-turn-helix transcriptional regulator n=1 Tax=Streptomyces albicerus TaxID=2569859 RepID=UPI001788B554|nr:LuxR family transcriptional regulator [Streptomyces albicerus]
MLLQRPLKTRVLELRGGRWTGKSTLLGRLSEAAAGQGWTVKAGSAAIQPWGQTPFGLFLQIVDDLLAQHHTGPPDSRPQLQTDLLSATLPGLADGKPGPVSDDPVARYQSFRTIRTLLESMSHPSGLLLILDDVHWVDEASLELLEYLLRYPPQGDVLLALAHRPRQTSHHLRTILNEVGRYSRVHRIILPGPNNGYEPSDHESDVPVPTGVSRMANPLLSGNPGSDHGYLSARASVRPAVDEPERAASQLPLDVLAEALRDFRTISRLGWRVARSAAILDEPFSPGLLQAVSETTDEELRSTIDELAREDIFETDATAHRLRFTSPLLRAAAHQSSRPGWLLGAHARAAKSLSEGGCSSVRLAAHLQHQVTTDDTRTGKVLLEAAAKRRWTDAAEAAIWAEAAMRIGGLAGEEGPAHVLLGSALALSGQFRRSLDALEGRARGEPDDEYGVEAVIWRAWALRMLGGAEAAEAELEQRLNEMTDAKREHRAMLLGARLASALHTGRTVHDALPAELRDLADALPADARGWAYALSAVAAARGEATGRIRAHTYVVTAAELLDELGDEAAVRRLGGLYWLGQAEAALEHPVLATGHLERGLGLAQQHRFHGFVTPFAEALARVEMRVGDLPSAARHAAVAVSGAEGTDSEYLRETSKELRRAMALGHEDRPAPDIGPSARGRPRETPPYASDQSRQAGEVLDALSKREMEIAVLVSGGRTNRQIARALVISQKTVETHLGRIFRKLVVSSRAEVAALVGRTVGDGRGLTGLNAS